MTDYVIAPSALASLPVSSGGQRFPIRRVFCVGRNYTAHAREMGKDPDREPPFFFMKPADAVIDANERCLRDRTCSSIAPQWIQDRWMLTGSDSFQLVGFIAGC
jgi:2-keto-4-pentenoate hydratase/2-oxohepta-3-ene-1,7-dioic acid hydratase in catechol pathway